MVTRGKTNKPASVKAAIVSRRTIGDSKNKIAKDLEISRPTVDRILEECNFDQLVENGRIRVHQMIPKACDAVESALDEKNGSIGVRVLQGVGVLNAERDSSGTTVNVQVLAQIQAASDKIVKEIMEIQDVNEDRQSPTLNTLHESPPGISEVIPNPK